MNVRLQAVVLHRSAADPDPSAVQHGTDLNLGACLHLPIHSLFPAGLKIHSALEQIHGAEGTDSGAVPIYRGQIKGFGFLQEIIYFPHRFLLFSFLYLLTNTIILSILCQMPLSLFSFSGTVDLLLFSFLSRIKAIQSS